MNLSTEEAIAIGCRKYRDIYPNGLIPIALEEQGVLGATPDDSHVNVHVTFWIEGKKDPFYLFCASVDRSCGAVSVEIAEDWRVLKSFTLSQSQSL